MSTPKLWNLQGHSIIAAPYGKELFGRTVATVAPLLSDATASERKAALGHAQRLIDAANREAETAATRDRLHAENAQLVAALKEIVVICTESRGDLRRRMGTRVGNILVSAKSALASQEQARSAIARAKGKDGAK